MPHLAAVRAVNPKYETLGPMSSNVTDGRPNAGKTAAAPAAARVFVAFLVRPAFKPKFAATGLDYRE